MIVADCAYTISRRNFYPTIDELVCDPSFLKGWHSLPLELQELIIKEVIEPTLLAADTKIPPPSKLCLLNTTTDKDNVFTNRTNMEDWTVTAHNILKAATDYKLGQYLDKIMVFVRGCDAAQLALQVLRQIQAKYKKKTEDAASRALLVGLGMTSDAKKENTKTCTTPLANSAARLAWLLKLDEVVRQNMEKKTAELVEKGAVAAAVEAIASEVDLEFGWRSGSPPSPPVQSC